jgi:hypothetical protein
MYGRRERESARRAVGEKEIFETLKNSFIIITKKNERKRGRRVREGKGMEIIKRCHPFSCIQQKKKSSLESWENEMKKGAPALAESKGGGGEGCGGRADFAIIMFYFPTHRERQTWLRLKIDKNAQLCREEKRERATKRAKWERRETRAVLAACLKIKSQQIIKKICFSCWKETLFVKWNTRNKKTPFCCSQRRLCLFLCSALSAEEMLALSEGFSIFSHLATSKMLTFCERAKGRRINTN